MTACSGGFCSCLTTYTLMVQVFRVCLGSIHSLTCTISSIKGVRSMLVVGEGGHTRPFYRSRLSDLVVLLHMQTSSRSRIHGGGTARQ